MDTSRRGSITTACFVRSQPMRNDAWASPSSKNRWNIMSTIHPMSALTVAAVVAAGAVAGGLGSLLGIGGGVFLVPFLNAGLGFDFGVARAVSLMTVIATSSAVSSGTAGRRLINLRLGMTLEVGSAIGGLIAGYTVEQISDS